jgi:hypothetical protein
MCLPDDHVLKFRLAPRFGALTGGAMEEMDKVICVMASVTINELIKATQNPEALTWKNLLATLLKNPALEYDDSKYLYRVATFKASQGIPLFRDQETKCWLQRKEASGQVRNMICDTDCVLKV